MPPELPKTPAEIRAAAEAVAKALKPKPETPPESALPEGVVFVGEGQPEPRLKQGEAADRQKLEDKPAIKETKRLELRGAKDVPPQAVIAQAAAENPILAQTLEASPIKDPRLEEFVAGKLMEGMSVRGMAQSLKYAVRQERFGHEARIEAVRFLDRLAVKTGDAEVMVGIAGGAKDFHLYSKGDLPTPEDPGEPPEKGDPDYDAKNAEYRKKSRIKRQHDQLTTRLESYQKFVDERKFDREEEIRYLERKVNELTEGYTGEKPSYSAEDARPFKEKMEKHLAKLRAAKQKEFDQREAARKAEAEQRDKEREEKRTKEKQAEDRKRKKEKAEEKAERDRKEADRKAEHEAERKAQEERWRKQQEAYSQFSLTLSEEIELSENPEKAVEKWIRNFYQPIGFPGDGEQESQRRINIYMGYLDSGEYRDAYMAKHPDTTKEQYFNMRRDLKEYVQQHTSIKLAQAAAETGIKFETVISYVTQAGERGWHGVMNANNGMNAVAFNLYLHELDMARSTLEPGRKRLTPADYTRARERVKQHFLENSAQYKSILEGERDITLEDADHFANVAHALAKVRQKTTVAMLKAMGPSEKWGDAQALFDKYDPTPNNFADSSSDEAIAASMDWVRFFSEKWGNLSPGQQRMARFIYEFAAIDVGFDGEFKRHVAALRLNGTYVSERDTILEKVWGKRDEVKVMGQKIISRGREKWREVSHGLMDEDEEYRRYWLSEKGRLVFGDMLDMYDHDSNGWRGEQILDQVNALWQESDTLALGYWFRRAGAPFLGARVKEAVKIFDYGSKDEQQGRKDRIKDSPWSAFGVDKEGNIIDEKNYSYGLTTRSILERIAQYRPQATALMHYEQNNTKFFEWWDKPETQRAAEAMLGRPLARPDEIEPGKPRPGAFSDAYDHVMHRFLIINERLARAGLPVINYKAGFSAIPEAHRAQVTEIVGSVLTGNKKIPRAEKQRAVDSYMTFMSGLSEVTGQPELIDQFRDNPNYRSYMKRTQWVDDARLHQIEKPETLKGPMVKGEAKERLPFSHYASFAGEGRRAPMARSWGDLMIGLELITVVREAITPDKKILFDSLKTIRSKEDIYAGAPSAVRAITYLLGGHAKMGATDSGLTEALAMGALPNSSEMKRYFGDHAPSYNKNDLDSLIDQLEFTNSKLHLYPGLKETVHKMEQYIGLSWKALGKNIRIPLAAFRGRMLIIAVTALIALEMAKQADQALSSETGGKSH